MEKLESLQKEDLQEPKMYKVVLLNDDVTTMDFVIEVLMRVFFHSFEKASELMMQIHYEGSGVCGIYTQEIALSKHKKVQIMAMEAQFPLQSRVEEE
ncbi:ATP-dependent Clp protease adaptor ClpS [Campylobacter helveticus]|uniref:ATP-dependent Clp protease adaptor ClpS n=1 Tax=Campylobacter helveticus TaxID=28898 RepID=UPI00214A7AB3|nr:ATP-dependent Clp protease adaptor ClpS [Campylobacter helveticus]MCR2062579.1 ATP-dependent Clp protease adaptor ClpS [Campylobacter helveticus]